MKFSQFAYIAKFCDDFNNNYDYSSIIDMKNLFKSSKFKFIPHLKTENVINTFESENEDLEEIEKKVETSK